MIKNDICIACDKLEVCKIADILGKFGANAKKNLGVDITINSCENYGGLKYEGLKDDDLDTEGG